MQMDNTGNILNPTLDMNDDILKKYSSFKCGINIKIISLFLLMFGLLFVLLLYQCMNHFGISNIF